MKHIINLSNGLIHLNQQCCNTESPIITRIQSTALEQKRWEAVIHGAGPGFFYALATEPGILIHDQSEKPRLTRAQWQGIPFLIHIARYAWDLSEVPAVMRGGSVVNNYFNDVLDSLHHSTIKEVSYFKKYLRGGPISNIILCDRRYGDL